MCWGKLELNSKGYWPFRSRIRHLSYKVIVWDTSNIWTDGKSFQIEFRFWILMGCRTLKGHLHFLIGAATASNETKLSRLCNVDDLFPKVMTNLYKLYNVNGISHTKITFLWSSSHQTFMTFLLPGNQKENTHPQVWYNMRIKKIMTEFSVLGELFH